jgi:hypothetical protein
VLYHRLKFRMHTSELHNNILPIRMDECIQMHVLFFEVCVKTHRNKHVLGCSIVIKKKDRNVAAPIVKTQHNDRMSIQQSGTTNLLNTCLHSTMKTVNFIWYIDVLCTNTFEEGFKLHQIVQEGLSLRILCLIQVCTVT